MHPKDCPKGPHSKEEWVEGSEWDFCYNCSHWHYLYPGSTTKPKPKKRAARKKQSQTAVGDVPAEIELPKCKLHPKYAANQRPRSKKPDCTCWEVYKAVHSLRDGG